MHLGWQEWQVARLDVALQPGHPILTYSRGAADIWAMMLRRSSQQADRQVHI